MSVCAACGEEIIWARTETGGRVPLGAQPHSEGTHVLVTRELLPTARPVSRVTTAPHVPRYRLHLKTCPQAGRRGSPPLPPPAPVLFKEPPS